MSGLRVIAGTARGRRLKMVPGDTTRPITDRVKESLFNILGSDMLQAEVLDLFAGTGGVGIEALSRGAARATFVDQERLALRTIQENLASVGLADRARVVRADVFQYLGQPPAAGFDYIHVAPPQYHELWSQTVQLLDAQPAWVNPDGVVVAQIDPREYAELTLAHLRLTDQRRYGATLLVFYEHPGT